MTRIPTAPLILGLAGVLPFLWSALTNAFPALASAAGEYLPPMFIGAYVGLTYGTIILSFMSGVLWGFATKATGNTAWVGYTLSVIPALWVFFMVTDASQTSLFYLATGFLALLGLDISFARQGLTPEWWVRLRMLLTTLVLICLGSLLLI
jgi:hypothetical protein